MQLLKRYITLVFVLVLYSGLHGQIQVVDALSVNAGSANGVKFWNGQDVYAINLGSGGEFLYGPVTSWAMKMNNANAPSRGWVWGVDGMTPSAAISVGGEMQISSNFRCMGNIGVNTTSPAHRLHVVGDGYITGNLGIGVTPNASIGIFHVSSTNNIGIQSWATNWGSIGADIRGGSRGVFAVAGATLSGGSQPNEAYGVWGIGMNASQLNCGVHGDGNGSGSMDYAFGVWGSAYNGAAATYGVYGDALGGFGSTYAGYFDGDVYSTGSYLPSDRKLKNNIEDLSNPTEQLMQLRPATYDYKTDEFPRMRLAEGKQMGFIAQEVKEVFPGLVKESIQPPKIDEDGVIVEEGTHFTAINYVGLIPLLTATVQEQEGKLEAQEATITELEARISALEQASGANKGANLQISPQDQEDKLFQNTPNPFSDRTEIRYTVQNPSASAQLMIFNMNGQMISNRDLEANKDGLVTILGHELVAGMYIYTLIVDGQEVDSRRMILTE